MSVKAVIDTNVLVSSFLSKNPNSPTVLTQRLKELDYTHNRLCWLDL